MMMPAQLSRTYEPNRQSHLLLRKVLFTKKIIESSEYLHNQASTFLSPQHRRSSNVVSLSASVFLGLSSVRDHFYCSQECLAQRKKSEFAVLSYRRVLRLTWHKT
uniref:(northern house mosquito) hypothetical protein n=1 Tax=Culex pipiens TaxID=7175 RepID=A0A8D8ATS8_CULPI